jgi:hypothetical protein
MLSKFRNWVLMAPEGESGSGAGVAATTTAPAQTVVAPPAPQQSDAAAQPSHRDWNEMAKNQRALLETVEKLTAALHPRQEPPKTEAKPTVDVATLAAELAEMKTELAFKEALIAAGVVGEHSEDLKLMWVGAGKPKENLADWIKGKASRFQSASTAAIPTPPVAPARAPSNTGAPAAAPGAPGTPDGDPMTWPPEVIDRYSPAELRKAIADFRDKARGGGALANFREMRRQLEDRKKNAR